MVALARGTWRAVARAPQLVTPGLPPRIHHARIDDFAAPTRRGARNPLVRCPECKGRASLRDLGVQHRRARHSEERGADCGRSGRSLPLCGPFASADWQHAAQASPAALRWMATRKRALLGVGLWKQEIALVAKSKPSGWPQRVIEYALNLKTGCSFTTVLGTYLRSTSGILK